MEKGSTVLEDSRHRYVWSNMSLALLTIRNISHRPAPPVQQGLGGILVESVKGDYNNVAGFPTYPFWRWMNELYEDGVFDE
jgi:hypothetical protein